MKKATYKFLLTLLYFSLLGSFKSSGQTDTLLEFLKPFIGEWSAPTPGGETDSQLNIGFKFEWGHPNQKLIRFYEGIPWGDMDKRILENLVAANPRTGEVDFIGYQMRDDFLFKGRFEPFIPGPGFVRLYEVFYPHDTRFKLHRDSLKGSKTYRDICTLLGRDTLECTTEQLEYGIWKPWGQGEPYRMIRRIKTGLSIPEWLLSDWAMRTANTGHWITDNATYKGENEPYDAYGLEWKYGLGNSHLKGRLYGIVNGKDVGTFWEFTEYWDPDTGTVRVTQIGSDGTLGRGRLWRVENGEIKEQQTFISPGGNSFESGHHVWMENGENHTQSFDIVEGEWIERRFYIWKQGK